MKAQHLNDLKTEKNRWQTLETSETKIKMFNAYYDDRLPYRRQGKAMVKILAYMKSFNARLELFCQLWYVGLNSPIISNVSEFRKMWPSYWGDNEYGYTPSLLGCENPLLGIGTIPIKVSLVKEHSENATNSLNIAYEAPKEQTAPLAVVTKLLDYSDDLSMMVIEWTEIMLLLGVSKIFVYVSNVHPNIMKVLEFYRTRSVLEIELFSFPDDFPDPKENVMQLFHNEMLTMNDCLYKHINEFSFIVPLDLDEIIVPTRDEDKTLVDLMLRIKKNYNHDEELFYSGYVFRNVFFLLDNIHENETQPDIPENLIFLQHIHRAANFSQPGVGVKSFCNTEKVEVIHNHSPMFCLMREDCDKLDVSEDYGRVQHYRRGCENYPKEECEDFKQNTVEDKTLHKYRKLVLTNVERTVGILRL